MAEVKPTYRVTRESKTKGYQHWDYPTKTEACEALQCLADCALRADPDDVWTFTITKF